MSKHRKVGIYDLDDNLIGKFKNNVELSKYLNISRVTVGKFSRALFTLQKSV